jgi:single-strand DNA-binding protein
MNSVQLLGNLTREPEARFTPKGTAVAKVGLAINRKWRNDSGELQEDVTFVDLEAFGKTAEFIAKQAAKGARAAVEGSLRMDTWEDKKTNAKRSRLFVLVERFELIDWKDSDGK